MPHERRMILVFAVLALVPWAGAPGAWSITTPAKNSSYFQTADIGAQGTTDGVSESFIIMLRLPHDGTVMNSKDVTSGPGGTWTTTLPAPQGGWQTGDSHEFECRKNDFQRAEN